MGIENFLNIFGSKQHRDVEEGKTDGYVPKKDFDELKLMYDTVVSHATSLENDLEDKLQEITRLSNTDSVTGAYNRRKFNESLEAEMEKAERLETSLSLIIFDIDYFKHSNDTLGHDYGDFVIITTAKIVREMAGKNEVFARWGGDEFAIILPDTPIQDAVMKAELIRRKIYHNFFSARGAVTCSFGVAQLREKDTMNSFVIRADKALYEAKQAGRNCVKFSAD